MNVPPLPWWLAANGTPPESIIAKPTAPNSMNLPESPHQAAIAGGTFKAKVRPTLHPAAAELVRVYESVPGALTYPGCCPEGLAAVLDHIIDTPGFSRPHPELPGQRITIIDELAAMLRGGQS